MDKKDEKPLPLPAFSGNGPQRCLTVDDDQLEGDKYRRAHGFTPISHDSALQPSSTTSPTESGISTVLQKRVSDASTPTTGWVLQDAPVLPERHPLARTAVFCPHSSAQSIAAQVSATLKNRSIQAKYNGSKADCHTMNNVFFTVFLYRGKKEYNHGIICEVLLQSGDSFCYWEDATAILDAAENKSPGEPRKKKAKSIPIVEDDGESEATISLHFLRNLFRAGSDSQLLGLQILSSMTDSTKMGSKAATATSRVLMEPGNEIAEIVLDLIKESSLTFQVMMVLSNIASVADLPLPFLKPVLIDKLQSKDSQVAYLASRCLKPQDVDADSEFADAIHKAKQLGAEGHDGLYNQAVALLESRGGV